MISLFELKCQKPVATAILETTKLQQCNILRPVTESCTIVP
jgi:hypothetical protein